MELQSEHKLSSQEYWDSVLESAQLPRINTGRSYLYNVTMKFVDPFIRNSNYKTFFEVGCGSSGWLPYFAKQYNLVVSGLDYSEVGCVLARKNLEMQNITYGEILHKDLFEPDCTDGKKYDIVFSYGVIEHFENPEKVMQIFSSFLNEGGIMITLVPNMQGMAGKLTKHYIKDVYDIHNVISSEQLQKIHEAAGLKVLKNRYAGIFSFGVMPLIKSDKGLLKKNTTGRNVSFLLMKAFDKIVNIISKIIPGDIPSRHYSPYVICVATKRSK